MSGKIFISYRRDDAPADARQLHDKLSSAFGKKRVFMDIDNLLAGQRFDKELEKALSDCDVFLAVIGPRWLELLSDKMNKNEQDYVHMEVFSALKRDIIVIPVLVHGAQLPEKDQLPPDIQNLLLHQKQELTHERYNSNVAELIRAIKLVQQSRKSSGNSGDFMRWGKFLALLMGLGLGAAYIAPYVFEEVKEWQQARIKAEQVDIEKQKKKETKVAVDVSSDKKPLTQSYKPGDTFKDCDECPEMVVVPPGEFMMGSPKSEKKRSKDEGPRHKVTIPKKFAVGQFEITFDEWDACVKDGGCNGYRPEDEGWGRENRPVINVSWGDAKAYVSWLSRKTKKQYRLLSEAEWEYVARAKTNTPFWWGNSISTSQANYDGNYTYNGSKGKFRKKTVPVDSFEANDFGLYNVHGNVWEWVEDCWHATYQGAPVDGTAWTKGGDCSLRVLRGGSWDYIPEDLRSANRDGLNSDYRIYVYGFRVSRTLVAQMR